MRPRNVVTAVLLAFIVIAVVLVARDAPSPKDTAPVVPAAMVTPRQKAAETAIVRVDDPLPQTAASPVKSQETPTRAVEANQAPAPELTAKPTTPSSMPVRTVVATYFHGDVRCTTCRKVESYAREAVEEGFAQQIAAGAVAFRAVNVDDQKNRHFIEDYQLTNKSVVVTDEVDGHVARWVKLDDVWSLVGNRPAYVTYVQDGVRGYLETR